jgi:hypothetical protein
MYGITRGFGVLGREIPPKIILSLDYCSIVIDVLIEIQMPYELSVVLGLRNKNAYRLELLTGVSAANTRQL